MEKMNCIKEYLSPILNDDVSDDIIQYISTFNTVEDYDDFMENIVDTSNRMHVQMYNKLKMVLFKTQSGKKNQNQRSQTKGKERISEQIPLAPSTSSSTSAGGGKGNNKGNKTKFTNFYSYDNKPGLRKGRHPCNCQASKHVLINNCSKCGRIVCEQEGSGPCLFCDNMVCTRQEMALLNAKTKESDKFRNHLLEQKKTKEFKQALENRNRLLQTDQMGATKNKVFDDQNDYFDLNSKWLNDKEKDGARRQYRGAREMLHKSKKDFKLALDFASRTVTINDDDQKKNHEKMLAGVNKLLDNADRRFPKNLFDGEKAELIAEIVSLMGQRSGAINKATTKQRKDEAKGLETQRKYRIANSEFLESVDQGMCLSMHQPWASLLVAGIKIHEGRTWRTDHRGRLWIAAGAKQPEDEDILTCEEMYRVIYNDDTIKFPKKYPTGCLLGCVFVEDCLEQSAYREKYPDGESDSPYVLICSNPIILPVFYPMQGQHKIFQLSKEMHMTTKAALMSSKWI
ncbi:PREDICTED: activating signal cointegrator 1 [Nicrophorus vespilloides]|uniref:Activating signal cointegrator 1 n=1 Tax=Nicrophorus vespilloides TaxID=110193 RepID=A0ABM1N167_NICVS|nr:PREDICTED: activating signal cointegrator 1 [Nicrophorus vespilloides]